MHRLEVERFACVEEAVEGPAGGVVLGLLLVGEDLVRGQHPGPRPRVVEPAREQVLDGPLQTNT